MKSCLVLSLLYDFYFRIGRKKTMILSVLGLLASSLAVSWAADFYLFCVLRFVVGFSSAGLFMSTFVHGDYLNIQFHCIGFFVVFYVSLEFFYPYEYVTICGILKICKYLFAPCFFFYFSSYMSFMKRYIFTIVNGFWSASILQATLIWTNRIVTKVSAFE